MPKQMPPRINWRQNPKRQELSQQASLLEEQKSL